MLNPYETIFSSASLESLKPILALIMEHKMAAALAFLLSSGIGAQVAIRLLNLLPLAWWYATVETVFFGISVVGGHRFTRPLWDPVENWFEAFLGKTMDAARRGLRRDNAVPGGAPATPANWAKTLEMQADAPPPPPAPGPGAP